MARRRGARPYAVVAFLGAIVYLSENDQVQSPRKGHSHAASSRFPGSRPRPETSESSSLLSIERLPWTLRNLAVKWPGKNSSPTVRHEPKSGSPRRSTSRIRAVRSSGVLRGRSAVRVRVTTHSRRLRPRSRRRSRSRPPSTRRSWSSHAEAMLDHQFRQPVAVDQHDLLPLDPVHKVQAVLREVEVVMMTPFFARM